MADAHRPDAFLNYMKEGEKRLAIGYNDEGEQVVLVGVPLDSKIPGKEDCIALVGELPIGYIADTLSLEDEDSLIYSFVIPRGRRLCRSNQRCLPGQLFRPG